LFPFASFAIFAVAFPKTETPPHIPEPIRSRRCACPGVTIKTYSPVTSFSSLKNQRLRSDDIDQSTGTLWYPCSNPSPFIR